MGDLTIGLIGAGRIGHQHGGTLQHLAEQLLIADAMEARATDLAGSLTNASAASIDEVFANSDAVVIASSTDSHAPFLEWAAAAGMPAFCEKPIALDLASTRKAMDAVEEAGIVVQMGFQRRYDPAIGPIASAVAAGEAGSLYMVRSQTHDPEPPPADYLPVSGGIFVDCLVHDIDAVRFVTGQEFVAVTAIGADTGFEEIRRHGDIDTGLVMGEMSGGTLAQLSCLRHNPLGYDVRLEAFGSEQTLSAGWGPRAPIQSMEPGHATVADPIVQWNDRFGDAYRAEMEAFVRVIKGEEAPASSPQDAYEALRVAVACTRSRAEGRRVALEEIE